MVSDYPQLNYYSSWCLKYTFIKHYIHHDFVAIIFLSTAFLLIQLFIAFLLARDKNNFRLVYQTFNHNVSILEL